MKQMICTICGLIGSSVAAFFGGWTSGMTTLLILMCIDYVTGLMVAGIFKKSKKTESGALLCPLLGKLSRKPMGR